MSTKHRVMVKIIINSENNVCKKIDQCLENVLKLFVINKIKGRKCQI